MIVADPQPLRQVHPDRDELERIGAGGGSPVFILTRALDLVDEVRHVATQIGPCAEVWEALALAADVERSALSLHEYLKEEPS